MVAVLPTVEDASQIVKLVDIYSQTGIVIKRPLEEIIQHIHDFRVIKQDDRVIGCVSMHIYSADLSELRTLIVDPDYHGKGIGGALVKAVMEWANKLSVKKLFTLTTEVGFFQRYGFQVIDKNSLPEKIFKDCQHCRFYDDCRETALWIEN